jgi:hypothetical protein
LVNRRISKLYRIALFLLCTPVLFTASALADGRVGNVKDDGSQFIAKVGLNSHWKVGQRLCVLHGSQVIACGTATERTSEGLVVILDANSMEISAGDVVQLARAKTGKSANSAPDALSEAALSPTPSQTSSKASSPDLSRAASEAPTSTSDLDELDKAIADDNQDAGEKKKPVQQAGKQTEIVPPADSNEPLSDDDRIQLMAYHRSLIDDQWDVESQETVHDNGAPAHYFNVSVGAQMHANAGSSFVWPTLYLQVALSRHFSIGLTADYVQYQVLNFTNSVPELFGVVEFFPMASFEGVFFRAAGGVSDNTATFTNGSSQATAVSFSAYALAGWRFYLQSGVSLAISAGASYYSLPSAFAVAASNNPNATSIDVIQPLGMIEVGIRF